MFRFCVRVALVMMLSAPPHVRADVLIVETTSANAGNRKVDGVRTTYISGARMRLEVVRADASTTTLYDVPAGTTTALDAKKRRAELRDISARNAELERQYPRERATVTLTPTGARNELVGTPCDEYAFSIRVPMTKDGNLALMMTGAAWVAKEVPGAADYAIFAKAAIDRQVVLGPPSNNKILLAITRAQTELYRALGELGGIPYVINMTLGTEGHGILAGMVNKVVSGTRTSTVTKVVFAPLSDGLFVIPDGWKHEKK
jgi:hypothetical protein